MNALDQLEGPIPDHVLEEVITGLDHRDAHGWIPWAWAVLARAGDVPPQVDEEHVHYPDHLVTLVGLAHLFDLFQDIASGGNADFEPDVDLVGEVPPQITPIEIARYCERKGIHDRQHPETGSGLLREAAEARAAELRARLVVILGGARLFTSLYVAGQRVPGAEADSEETAAAGRLTDEAVDAHLDSVVNEDPTEDKQCTYAWLEGDLDLG